MNLFEYIIGYEIIKVLEMHDYIQLYFDNGAILNINDEFKCNFQLQSLVSKKIEGFNHKNDNFEIIFNDQSLMIILLYTSYNRECMSLVTKDNKHFVWN